MTRRTINLCIGAAITAIVAGCSASDSVATAPRVTASASVEAKAVDAQVAVSTANAVMADLDNFVTSDVFAGAAASVNVTGVSLVPSAGDNTPPPSTPPTTPPTTSSGTSSTGTATPATPENHDAKPAGTPPTMPASGNPCHDDASHSQLQCVFANASESSASTITFLDNKGVKTAGFVRGVTDTVRTTLVASKKVTSPDSTLRESLYRNSQRAVGGFLDPNGTRTTNGAGTGADTSVFKSGIKSRTFAGISADTVIALVFAEHRATNPYPKSGTMIHVVQSTAVEDNGEGKLTTTLISRRVVVTYDGSATATISVGTSTCLLRLDTRKVDSCK